VILWPIRNTTNHSQIFWMSVAVVKSGFGCVKSLVAILLCRSSFCQFKGKDEMWISGSEPGSSKPIMNISIIDEVEGVLATLCLF